MGILAQGGPIERVVWILARLWKEDDLSCVFDGVNRMSLVDKERCARTFLMEYVRGGRGALNGLRRHETRVAFVVRHWGEMNTNL